MQQVICQWFYQNYKLMLREKCKNEPPFFNQEKKYHVNLLFGYVSTRIQHDKKLSV